MEEALGPEEVARGVDETSFQGSFISIYLSIYRCIDIDIDIDIDIYIYNVYIIYIYIYIYLFSYLFIFILYGIYYTGSGFLLFQRVSSLGASDLCRLRAYGGFRALPSKV